MILMSFIFLLSLLVVPLHGSELELFLTQRNEILEINIYLPRTQSAFLDPRQGVKIFHAVIIHCFTSYTYSLHSAHACVYRSNAR